MRKPVIGVIGAGETDQKNYELAYELGMHIANRDAILVCGGLSGIMEAVSKGVSDNGGIVIGLLPGFKKEDANQYVHIVIPTGFGNARNVLVVNAADVIIAFPGAFGTLSEMALALAGNKTVVYLPGTWDLKKIGPVESSRFKEAFDARQAIGFALNALGQ